MKNLFFFIIFFCLFLFCRLFFFFVVFRLLNTLSFRSGITTTFKHARGVQKSWIISGSSRLALSLTLMIFHLVPHPDSGNDLTEFMSLLRSKQRLVLQYTQNRSTTTILPLRQYTNLPDVGHKDLMCPFHCVRALVKGADINPV